MGVIIHSFNLNFSPKMSYCMLQHDIVVTELHAYDFVIKDFVIKKGHYPDILITLRARLPILLFLKIDSSSCSPLHLHI